MKPAIILCTLLSVLFSGLLTGCGEVRQAFDCRRICNAYADCVPGDQDVQECTDTCREQEGEAFEDAATECQRCIDDPDNDSCSEEIFACADECAGVL